MSIYQLSEHSHAFPPTWDAEPDGLLAVGGDLEPLRLLTAYSQGIFPWFSDGEPILWWTPAPRLVLFPKDLKVSRSMRSILRKGLFQVTFDTSFREVIQACRQAPRKGQDGTWITLEMQGAYQKLFDLGYAHSVEVWQEEELVGGLYGIALGNCFFGESMFAKRSNASKVGFIHLVRGLERMGFNLVDCQTRTEHLVSLGACEISRTDFEGLLNVAVDNETRPGPWTQVPELLSPPIL